MPAAKMETAAERYRRIKQERAASQELFDFTSPSGMEWKLRKVDRATFILNGTMPMSLAQNLAAASEISGGDTKQALLSLESTDQVRFVQLMAKIVRHCAVVPRIVENPTGPDEIGFDEVELDDFNAICVWAMDGGGAAEGLDTFHPE